MADFRQLALEFVLTEDAATQSRISTQAANLIRDLPRNANPVARWVESIKPWMPGNEDTDDQMEDGDDGGSSGDVIARAKALQFLASTLELLDKEILKPDQIKLLIAFFSAMFTVDHKAGILPSAKSLTTICTMQSFSPQSGTDILQSVCSMGDDFKNQIAETRLAIYELFHLLIADPNVSSDLQHRHGAASGFMLQMLQLCRNERDPKNILKWFSILETLLTEYSPSPEVTEEIFGAYSSYFPISLRTSKHPSGITPADLKMALRKCFSAHDRVAKHAIPYLMQKLDQGDQVSVDVKVDILETLKQCLQKYTHVQQSIAPHVDKIWTSLKYEVRNGEVEETINGTLDVIRTMTGRLEDDELRNFTLTVLRECTDDLGNPTYAGQVGKLLVCVASANAGAFIMIVSPTVKHVKEHLRHTKSKDHKRDLLALLNSILEVRLLFVNGEVSLGLDDSDGLKSTDPVLVGLYDESYKGCLDSDKTAAKKAIEGMGLLVCQPSTVADGLLLVPDTTCEGITTALSDILVDCSNDLADDAMVAMQRASMAWPAGFAALIDRALGQLHSGSSVESASDLMTLTSRLSYIGCLEVSKKRDHKFSYFVRLVGQLLQNMDRLLSSSDRPSQMWAVYPTAIQSCMRYFQDALNRGLGSEAGGVEFPDSISSESWVEHVANKYPGLPQIDRPQAELERVGEEEPPLPENPVDPKSPSSDETYADFLLICLYVTRQLYRRSTRIVAGTGAEESPARLQLSLSDELNKGGRGEADAAWKDQYLHFLATLATFAVGQFSQAQQIRFQLHEDVVTLFRSADNWNPRSHSAQQGGSGEEYRKAAFHTLRPWSTYQTYDLEDIPPELATHNQLPIALSFGILQPLHPAAIEPLFGSVFGPEFVAGRLLLAPSSGEDPCLPYFLMILANKYKIETVPKVLALLERQMAGLAAGDTVQLVAQNADQPFEPGAGMVLATNIYAMVAGILRRYTGDSLAKLFESLCKAPSSPEDGHVLARKFDSLFRPHSCLEKGHNAIVRKMWAQKAYMLLVKPILPLAWPKRSGDDSELACANYSVAVLSAVRHLSYDVYDADAADLVRMILCVLRSLPVGPDVEVALRVLETITKQSTDVLEPFLKSVTVTCTAIIRGTSGGADMSWMPEGYSPVDRIGKVSANCRNLAIMLLGYLPQKYEHRHLLESSRQVQRLLYGACGDRVREVRRAAMAARIAWAGVE